MKILKIALRKGIFFVFLAMLLIPAEGPGIVGGQRFVSKCAEICADLLLGDDSSNGF